jgi:ABC-type lipoprotein release transport system permease subunit
MRLGPGPAGRAALKHLDRIFDGNLVVSPDEVGDFGRIENMPLYIVLLFAAGAGAALAHTLTSGVRRRRRDLAILKTLGFTRAQVAATVSWQATIIVAGAALIGVPLGLGLGRLLWNLFAADLGVQPEAVAPFGLALLVVPGVVLFANAIAALPGWAAARVRCAVVLRTE